MDNHHYQVQPHLHNIIAAAGQVSVMHHSGELLNGIKEFDQEHHDWIFGHLGYDLKNEIENFQSAHQDMIGFADAFLFVPEYVFIVEESSVGIGSLADDHEKVFNEISRSAVNIKAETRVNVQQRLSKQEYLFAINKLQEHIQRGDCYEVNFCQEFFAEDAEIDPFTVYQSLSELSPNPFSVYYRIGPSYLLCASPERFMLKFGNKLVSQPIKGTIARDLFNPSRDLEQKAKLQSSQKDQTENVMIVDLVRNDLSRICIEGTVKVEELFGIYEYPQVYQMVSTVSGELKTGADFSDIVRVCFPMGSMTGAPKRKVLELIERYESSRRGIFSGSVGYITPGKDFDFNVVIRSIMYNEEGRYLSFLAGSGITASSIAEQEYEECLLKASAIIDILGT